MEIMFSIYFHRLTSRTVPLVMTPNDVYNGELGFFLTPIIGNWNVAFNSGWVTCAFVNRNALSDEIIFKGKFLRQTETGFAENFTIGRMNRSYFGGFRVKPSPTKHGFVTKRFHAFSKKTNWDYIFKKAQIDDKLRRFPDWTTRKTSASLTALTCGMGTSHLP